MQLTAIPTGPFEEICYVVWNDERQALVFDPGHDEDRILQALEERALEVAAYVCTHGHADHISALAAMHAVRPAPIAMHGKDLEWAFSALNQIAPYYAVPIKPEVDDFLMLESAEDWHLGNFDFQCMETPGHTPGHVSVHIESQGEHAIISGDMMHHPCQIARPEWVTPFDADNEAACATRKAFLERYADEPVLVFGTHFANPVAGRIVRDGKTYRFDV